MRAFCSTRSTVVPRRRTSAMIANTAWTITGAKPSDGSSRSRMRGFAISPRASATIWSWPPESVQPSASPKRRMSGKSSNMPSASSLIWRVESPFRLEAPSMMFSRTVRPGKTRRPSGTCATPRRTISSGFRPSSDRPSNSTSPPAGFTRPEMVFSVVDLPAPLEPSSVTTSPASTENEMPRTASISP